MKKSWILCWFLVAMATAAPAQVNKPGITDPAEKAKSLQHELKLSDDQTAKVTTILQESSQQLDRIKKAEHGDPGKIAKAEIPLRASTLKSVRGVLTPPQAAKLNALVKHGNWAPL